jgi:hypothetical protein
MHAEIALPALSERLPGLKTAGDPTWLASVPVRQVGEMPVTWDRSSPDQACGRRRLSIFGRPAAACWRGLESETDRGLYTEVGR